MRLGHCTLITFYVALLAAVLLVAATDHTIVQGDASTVERSHSTASWHYAPFAPSLYRDYAHAPKLHFAVISVPLWGHFQPLYAIAEELAHRGHHITFFVERPSWCARIVSDSNKEQRLHMDCVEMPSHPELFTSASLAEISRTSSLLLGTVGGLFSEIFAHHKESLPGYIDAVTAIHAQEPFTTFLCDSTTFTCGSVARLLDVPVVHSFPFTLQLSTGIGLGAHLPAMGTGFPRDMDFITHLKNYVVKFLTVATSSISVARLNRIRRAWGVPLLRNAYDAVGLYDTIITPSIWGLDIPQLLCPNVHPVGPLLSRLDRQPPALQPALTDDGLAAFLDGCAQGVVYVNFGTLAVPTPDTYRRLAVGLSRLPFCVVWKLPSASEKQLKRDVGGGGTAAAEAAAASPMLASSSQFFFREWFSSSMAVLKHKNVFAFVSHCGDVSVMESIDAGVPTLGIPIFADQGDVCQRVAEAGAGLTIGHKATFTADDVVDKVWQLVKENSLFASSIHKLQRTAKFLGGPPEAANIVEWRQHNLFLRRNASMERCAFLDHSNTRVWFLVGWYQECLALLLSTAVAWWLMGVAFRIATSALHSVRRHYGLVVLRGAAGSPAAASTKKKFRVVPRAHHPPGTQGHHRHSLRRRRPTIISTRSPTPGHNTTVQPF